MISLEKTAGIEQEIHFMHGDRPKRDEEASLREMIHPLRESLWETLLATETEAQYIPDRDRQREVFERIDWETFQKEVFEGVGDVYTSGAGKQIRGKLFEMLIQNDSQFGFRSELEKELLILAHSPEKFGLAEVLGHHRNPDLAFLIVERDDGVVIEGVGESKLGLLNERSFKQLSETGFTLGVHALVDVVNNLEDPASHGLVELAKVKTDMPPGKPVLTIDTDFSQLLVVPANRNTAWSSTLVNRREFSAAGRKEFYELLENTKRVRTANAAFSTAEVTALTKHLVNTVYT